MGCPVEGSSRFSVKDDLISHPDRALSQVNPNILSWKCDTEPNWVAIMGKPAAE